MQKCYRCSSTLQWGKHGLGELLRLQVRKNDREDRPQKCPRIGTALSYNGLGLNLAIRWMFGRSSIPPNLVCSESVPLGRWLALVIEAPCVRTKDKDLCEEVGPLMLDFPALSVRHASLLLVSHTFCGILLQTSESTITDTSIRVPLGKILNVSDYQLPNPQSH